ncbi:MAG: PAS domain-containing protein [Candidatus Eisenbacteria bacterium]|uniref:histidine kinase n=1 Tax=Eiseniibacteriota bacterium TaxID=2212470 RepID=A0A538SCJ6_UNCEI|nr:MAG: PAS domain-containing protein [Candidatus Eisenbacteria bacterium]
MIEGLQEPGTERISDSGLAIQAVILGRVVLLVLVTVMAVVFSGASLGFDRQFPFWFFLFAVGVLGLAYRRVLRSGGDTKTLLATQFIVDVGTTSYLVFFTGGAESQFVPLYLLSPLLGGIFLSVRGGVFLAAAASMAYAGFYLAARQGLMPSMGYGMTQGLGDGAILLRVLLYVPLLFVVGVIGGRLGRRIQEGRRALETARAELNRALFDTESILENMSSGLVTVDADGVVRHWNRAASEISGCAVDAMRSRPYVDALGPGLAEFTIRMRDALEHGAPSSRAEITITKPDGTKVPLGISTSLLRDPDGRRRGVIGLFQDLSEVRALEERIRRRETLAAIGELSAGIAHEIRNCLNPISGSVEVLQRELKVKGENARLLDLVVRESERLDNFIRELLDYARERPLKCEDLDLESLLTDIVDVARRHPSAEGKTLRFVGQGESVYVHVDSEQMRQVLLNLVLNALEAVDPEGKVDVRVAARRNRPASPMGAPATTWVCVEVQDNGIGIAAPEVELIFEPFYSTKRGGTGLGLAIANRIVERHGGALEVESRLGAGTTMRVWVPRSTSTARTVAHAA